MRPIQVLYKHARVSSIIVLCVLHAVRVCLEKHSSPTAAVSASSVWIIRRLMHAFATDTQPLIAFTAKIHEGTQLSLYFSLWAMATAVVVSRTALGVPVLKLPTIENNM